MVKTSKEDRIFTSNQWRIICIFQVSGDTEESEAFYLIATSEQPISAFHRKVNSDALAIWALDDY